MDSFITMLWFASTVLLICLAAWLFSLVFRVKESIKLQKIQIRLLHQIALKAGVDAIELKQIVGEVIAVY